METERDSEQTTWNWMPLLTAPASGSLPAAPSKTLQDTNTPAHTPQLPGMKQRYPDPHSQESMCQLEATDRHRTPIFVTGQEQRMDGPTPTTWRLGALDQQPYKLALPSHDRAKHRTSLRFWGPLMGTRHGSGTHRSKRHNPYKASCLATVRNTGGTGGSKAPSSPRERSDLGCWV